MIRKCLANAVAFVLHGSLHAMVALIVIVGAIRILGLAGNPLSLLNTLLALAFGLYLGDKVSQAVTFFILKEMSSDSPSD